MGEKRKSSSETSPSAKRSRPVAPGDQDTASSARRNWAKPTGQSTVFAVSAGDSEDDDTGFASTREAMAYLRTVRYAFSSRLSRSH